MFLCRCDQPNQDRSELRCKDCGEWAPHGHPLDHHQVSRLAEQVRLHIKRVGTDLRYAVEVAYGIAGPSRSGRSAPGPADSTASHVLGVRGEVANWAALSSRLAERGLLYLRLADKAAEKALQVAEPDRHGSDHVRTIMTRPGTFTGRPDLVAAHEAQQRRQRRGDL